MKETEEEWAKKWADDLPQDPNEPIIMPKEGRRPRKYTEEAVVDGEKITVYINELYHGDIKVIRKSRRIILFGREFELPLHADITPMIVRYTGKTIKDYLYFDHGEEYMVIAQSKEEPEDYYIVDESGDNYVLPLTNFEIVSEGDGPPPKRFLKYWAWKHNERTDI